ncbi:wiskott-Aldrich syndrome protein family member 2 [Coccinella septempunctata]|uniref:wiskott-Aldrich syndrome protein family member 2 n=1 Tax=Coccinella septempunctata TaxID=41139 RepID=UPI001D089F18|nr:wiskott-Aldrich syndrome protein family member 2 [Coccinella septempunctata]XP_044760685.1 wiskott-Aldrich syndrome protein family member 2 [Coccinella septempunctata]XP_044760686.1 wiskott-Aldrich syndrome protein family member 2 [Coccinella septempunctata]
MPLPKRVIEPVHITRGTLPEDFPLPSELEAVTNGTLANTVRQLSSLSKHAEDLFGELARDAQQLYDRSNSLQARIDRLAIKVTQLDSNVEEVSLQDIHMRKAFKSAVVFDQQIFSRATMPTAMLETYNSCDKPPPLDKLNCYRDDGKDGLKFYTDPNYFFELWRQEMLIDTERMMHDRGKKPHRPRTAGGEGNRHKKGVRRPHNTRERQKQIAMGHGEYIMPQNSIYRTPQLQIQPMPLTEEIMQEQRPPRPNSIEIRRSYQQEVTDGLPSPTYPRYDENPYQQGMYGQGPLSSESLYQSSTPTRSSKVRPSQPPPAPPSNSSTPSANTPTRSIRGVATGRDTLPPPPPPPETTMSPPNGIPPHIARSQSQSRSNSPHSHQGTPEPNQDLPPPPPIPKQASPPKAQTPVQASPPPPPPPMPLSIMTNGAVNLPLVNGDLAKILQQSPPKLNPVKDRPVQKQLPPLDNPRNDLLKAIRDGIKLRKVEKIEQKEVERHDVASILARRVAVEFSESESGSDSEDSEGWGDNETSA